MENVSSRMTLMLFVAVLCGLLAMGTAVAEEHEESASGAAPGVNPADNLTKFEILPKYTVLDDSSNVSIFTTTLKYDKALNAQQGFNVELPLARFESPVGSDTGLGDLNLRFRNTYKGDPWTYIVGLEGVVPTATADSLGTGKWQLNPTAAAVYAFAPNVFGALVVKHQFSVAGEGGRDDISTGLYRLLYGKVSPKGMWTVLDSQVYHDYENDYGTEWVMEAEFGKMVSPVTGVWVRGGGHVGGDWNRQDWNIQGGIRFLSY